MSDHPEVSARLIDYVDGVIDAGHRMQVRLHIEHCEECRNWVSMYRLLRTSLQSDRKHSVVVEHPDSEDLATLAIDPLLLEPSQRAELEQHIELCPDCSEDLSLTRQATGVHAPWAKRLTAQSQFTPARSRTARYALAAVLSTILLGTALLVGLRTDKPGRDIELLGRSIDGKLLLETSGSVLAEDSTIGIEGDVHLRAGDVVVFGEGFAVRSGAELTVETVAASYEDRAGNSGSGRSLPETGQNARQRGTG